MALRSPVSALLTLLLISPLASSPALGQDSAAPNSETQSEEAVSPVEALDASPEEAEPKLEDLDAIPAPPLPLDLPEITSPAPPAPPALPNESNLPSSPEAESPGLEPANAAPSVPTPEAQDVVAPAIDTPDVVEPTRDPPAVTAPPTPEAETPIPDEAEIPTPESNPAPAPQPEAPAPRPTAPRPAFPLGNATESTLFKTAETQYANGEFDAALVTLEALLLKQQNRPKNQAETYNLIGLVHDRRDRFDDSSQAYQKALALYQGLSNSDDVAKQGEAKTLNNLGTLYAAADRIPEALGFLERSLGLSRQLKARGNEAITLRNLGNLYLQVDRFEEAIRSLEDSLAIEIELQRPSQIVAILDRLSNIYDAVGSLPKAIVATEEALKIVETTSDDEAKLVLLDRLANLYANAGSSSKAVATYEKALILIQRANEPILEGRLRNRMASLYEELNQTEQALSQYEAVLAIATAGDDSLSQARILTSMGDLYRRGDQWEQANESYNKALALVDPLEDSTTKPIAQGRLLSALAAIAKEQSQWDEALKFAQKALAVQQAPGADSETQARLDIAKAVSFNLLGDIYAQQEKYDPATQAYRQSLAALGQRGNPILQGTNLSSLGRVLMQQSRPAEAIKPLKEATRIWEIIGLEAAQGDDRDLVEDSYRLLVDAQLAQENTGAALEVVEQQRSRLLRTFLDLRQPESEALTPALSLAQIQQQASQSQATFVIYDNEQEATPGSSQLKDKALRIWVVPPQGDITFKRLPLDSSLGSLARRGDRNSLAALSKLLLEPIKSALPKDANATVMVVPTPELGRVPFAALPLGSNKALLDRYSLVTLPSLKALARPTAARATGPSVTALVAGDPAVPNLGRRPVIAEATEAVATLLGVEPLVGEAATLDAIAPVFSRAQTIHLAVPQLQLANGNEAIAFANPQTIEGITPADILSLKLQANLVTIQGLVAQADRQDSDDFALPQAFLSAGVPTVIASTADGDDRAAQKIMTELYQRLSNNKTLTPAQALRQAMLQVRKQHPEPKDWASFIVMGQ